MSGGAVDPCPILRTPRLTLEPLRAAHADALYPGLADAELWRYNDGGPPADPGALRERYRRLEARHSPDGRELWLNWVLRRGADCAGFVQATVAADRSGASIAYVVVREFQSAGLATEAAAALMRFLVDVLHVPRLSATVDRRNPASVRVLEKLGFALADAADPENLAYRWSGRVS